QTFDGNIYTDSTFTHAYVPLTKDQKVKLIAPFMHKLLGINAKYCRDLMSAYFISKQDKVGDLQPIILSIGGDDYGSITMIIINSNNKPVGGVNLEGGFDAGPDDLSNEMIAYEAKSYSTIDDDKIITYRIKHIECTNDSLKKPTTIDSTIYASTIDKSGKIKTRIISNVKYQVPYKPASK
ncbi:MAG TPA: hypothetical protein VFE54_02125, partial [Mucilaginibacter sp.]|nr:hypothetical protein [Mucilaginibacter sp.]